MCVYNMYMCYRYIKHIPVCMNVFMCIYKCKTFCKLYFVKTCVLTNYRQNIIIQVLFRLYNYDQS